VRHLLLKISLSVVSLFFIVVSLTGTCLRLALSVRIEVDRLIPSLVCLIFTWECLLICVRWEVQAQFGGHDWTLSESLFLASWCSIIRPGLEDTLVCAYLDRRVASAFTRCNFKIGKIFSKVSHRVQIFLLHIQMRKLMRFTLLCEPTFPCRVVRSRSSDWLHICSYWSSSRSSLFLNQALSVFHHFSPVLLG